MRSTKLNIKNVVLESSPVAEQVSFNPQSDDIPGGIAGIAFAFPLSTIPEGDFEPTSYQKQLAFGLLNGAQASRFPIRRILQAGGRRA